MKIVILSLKLFNWYSQLNLVTFPNILRLKVFQPVIAISTLPRPILSGFQSCLEPSLAQNLVLFKIQMVCPNTRSQLNSMINESNKEEYHNQKEAIEREDPTSPLIPIKAVEEDSNKDTKVL